MLFLDVCVCIIVAVISKNFFFLDSTETHAQINGEAGMCFYALDKGSCDFL